MTPCIYWLSGLSTLRIAQVGLGYTHIGKIYLDGTKIKGNASAKRTKDKAGFEKWLSEITGEIASILKEAEIIDNQEDDHCKTDPEQEVLQKRLSDRTYLKSKIEEALEIMKEENRYHYSNFTYDSASDSYVCPEGKRLTYWKTGTNKTDSRQWNHKVYKGTECGN